MSGIINKLQSSFNEAFFPNGYNRNLSLIYTYTFTSQFARAIWEGNIISSYIYIISNNSHFTVGVLTGLNGLSLLLFSPITGYAADKYPRIQILRLSSSLGLICTLFMVYSVYMGDVILFAVGMVIWGLFLAITYPTLDALLADTVDNGSRSRVYSTKLSLTYISGAVGPLLSIILFCVVGDEWTEYQCQVVMLCGLLLFVVPLILLRYFKDDSDNSITNRTAEQSRFFTDIYANVKSRISTRMKSFSVSKRRKPYSSLPIHEVEMADSDNTKTRRDQNDSNNDLFEPLFDFPDDSNSADMEEYEFESDFNPIKLADNTTADPPLLESNMDTNLRVETQNEEYNLVVPLMIAIGDVISGLAAGMTIKFFPIFFMNELHMGPIAVSVLYMITPFFVVAAANYTQKLSLLIGRVAATVATKTIGASLLLVLTYLTAQNYGASIVIPVYILRSAFINAPKPLTKSIIMDVVPKNQRGRWNAAETINGAMWAGSALFGGYLIDKYGFVQNFLITAIMQFIALIPLILVSRKIPAEKSTNTAPK